MKTEEGSRVVPGRETRTASPLRRWPPSSMPKKSSESGERFPKEYDVRLQVLAEGPLSGYRVLISPGG